MMKTVAALIITVLIAYKGWHLNELIEFKKLTITMSCKYENYGDKKWQDECTNKRIKNIDYVKLVLLSLKNI